MVSHVEMMCIFILTQHVSMVQAACNSRSSQAVGAVDQLDCKQGMQLVSSFRTSIIDLSW